MFYLNQTHFYTSQGGLIFKSFMVAGVSSFFGTGQQCGRAAFLAASACVQS